MDEARTENRQRIAELKRLNEIVHEVDDMTADGEVTLEEITRLREKLRKLEKIVSKKGDL
jgi:hypothetical protein